MNRAHTSSNRRLEDLFERVRIAKLHGAFRSESGRCVLFAFEQGARDPDLLWFVEQECRRIEEKLASGTIPPFLPPQFAGRAQSIELGEDTLERQVGLDVNSRTGVFVAMRTGEGKSSLAKKMAPSIVKAGAMFMQFDMEKPEGIELLCAFKERGLRLCVARFSDLTVNLCQFCTPERFADVSSRGLSLQEGGARLFKEALRRARLKHGDKTTFVDVFEEARNAPNKDFSRREALLDRLRDFLMSLPTKSRACRDGMTPRHFEDYNLVFDLSDESEIVKHMFSELTFFDIFERRKREPWKQHKGLWIFFEDPQRYFYERAGSDLTSLSQLGGIIRSTGIRFCPFVQSLRNFPRSLMANLPNKIMGALGIHEDYQALAADMALSPEQLAWARTNLRRGTYIARIENE